MQRAIRMAGGLGGTAPRGAASLRAMSSGAHSYGNVKKVGVIGGGSAGIQMARSLAAAGIEAKVFDKYEGPGGLWRENYAGYGLQASKQLWEFPDYPNTISPRGTYASGKDVQAYIEGFVNHFGLMKHFIGNTEVSSIAPRADGQRGWTFRTKHTKTGAESTEDFDFCVVATGMYSSENPNMPELKGREAFEGAGGVVTHSSKFFSEEAARGKNVVVVGGAKSAIDCVCVSSEVAKSATMLYRTAHWSVPQNIAGLIPFQYVFASRLGQALVILFKGTLHGVNPFLGGLHKIVGAPMRLVFSLVETLFAFQGKHYGDFRPKHDVVSDAYYGAHILNGDFNKKRKSGQVKTRKGQIASMSAGELTLIDGSTLPCDLLVCATGFGKSYDYMPKETLSKLGVEEDGLYLYRHMLHPKVPDMAFCGSEIATLINNTTHGVQAEWITRALMGQMQLPSTEKMEEEMSAHKAWKRSWMLPSVARAPMVLLHYIHYHQSLLKDMGEKTARLGGLSEYLMPYESSAYNGVVGKASADAAAKAAPTSAAA